MTGCVVDARVARWREQLGAEVGVHREVRARFGKNADPRFIDRVLACYRPPEWAVGSIGVLDAVVLRDAVCCVGPSRVVEIGTAAGVSTLVLAGAMRELGRSGVCVHTYDLHPWCFFDRSRGVGSAIDGADPLLAGLIDRRVRRTAVDAGRELSGVGLAFIDGDHRHPMPCADVLALLPALSEGAWVVLHDVDLPAAADRYERLHGVRVDWKQYGAQWLFESWPFEKFVPSGHANIGLLRIPAGRRVTPDDLGACLARPWETTPGAGVAGLLAA